MRFAKPFLPWSAVIVATVAVGILEPSVDAAPAAEPPWRPLFDGATLAGWQAPEHRDAFTVVDGAIVARGRRSHLFYTGPVADHDFTNFELRLEVRTRRGSNSGVYFHTRYQGAGWPARGYEVQINNSHTDHRRTGGLYAVQDTFVAPARDDTWFELSIRVEGLRVVTRVDGRVIADYTQPPHPDRSLRWRGRVLGHGTFALQAHDPDSEVHFRNIRVRLLP